LILAFAGHTDPLRVALDVVAPDQDLDVDALRGLEEPEGRTIARRLIRGTTAFSEEEDGSIGIPQDFLDRAGLVSSEVVAVGVMDRIELWDPGYWRVEMSAFKESDAWDVSMMTSMPPPTSPLARPEEA
jgi:hypothetical protein